MKIHTTAVVAAGAELDASVTVGPFAVIGPAVRIGAGCEIGAHAVIEGSTTLGAGSRVGPHVVLGAPAQVREHRSTAQPDAQMEHRAPIGRLEIGEGNWIREFATVHAGFHGLTTIGGENLLMAYSHVAHDCRLGDGVELANGVQLAGHVVVGDNASLGGLAAVHQFVRVGELSFVGAGAMVAQDVPPFALVSGDRARCYGVNTEGLKRREVGAEERSALRRAFKLLYAAPSLSKGLEQLRAEFPGPGPVERLVAFCEVEGRGICRPNGGPPGG